MKGYELLSGFPGPFLQLGSPMSTTTDHLDQVDTDPLHIVRWHDPLIDQLGHDPRSRYAELFWLGVLGPSTCSIPAISPLHFSARETDV